MDKRSSINKKKQVILVFCFLLIIAELVDRLFSAGVKTSHYDGIKARKNTFQSTKSTIDLVDKNKTAGVSLRLL